APRGVAVRRIVAYGDAAARAYVNADGVVVGAIVFNQRVRGRTDAHSAAFGQAQKLSKVALVRIAEIVRQSIVVNVQIVRGVNENAVLVFAALAVADFDILRGALAEHIADLVHDDAIAVEIAPVERITLTIQNHIVAVNRNAVPLTRKRSRQAIQTRRCNRAAARNVIHGGD